MKTPERSPAIARALAAEQDGLPKDFATQVARLAEAAAEARSSKWNEVALSGLRRDDWRLCSGVARAGGFRISWQPVAGIHPQAGCVPTLVDPWNCRCRVDPGPDLSEAGRESVIRCALTAARLARNFLFVLNHTFSYYFAYRHCSEASV